MLRLGRGLQMLRLGKRALPMLRMGRSSGDIKSGEYLQNYILDLMRKGRQVPLPRYGKAVTLQSMIMNALKNVDLNIEYDDDIEPRYEFGYDFETTPERQIRPAPRPGRYRRSTDNVDNEDQYNSKIAGDDQADAGILDLDELNAKYDDKWIYERDAPLMKFGMKTDENEVDKRAMRMLRLGRGMRMLRLGKRPADEPVETDKRALRLLRLGKRPRLAMLRMGRGDMEDDKRALRLLRLGKRSMTDES